MGQDKAGVMGRLRKKKGEQGLKNTTFCGWEENELKRVTKREIGEGEDQSGDKLVCTEFFNMASIDNLYFGVPGWDFGFKETGSCKYGLL